jgi:predicted metal-dependent hydrolase
MNPRRVSGIDYQLLPGSNRKTTDIVIERNGVITVRPPAGYTPEQVDAVVAAKRMWIYRNLAEWRDLNAAAVARRWVNGETFLYLGRCYRLSLVADQERDLMLKDGRFCLKRSLIERGGEPEAKRAFEAYYIPSSRQNPKIPWVDDAEIVRDRIAQIRPVLRDFLA